MLPIRKSTIAKSVSKTNSNRCSFGTKSNLMSSTCGIERKKCRPLQGCASFSSTPGAYAPGYSRPPLPGLLLAKPGTKAASIYQPVSKPIEPARRDLLHEVGPHTKRPQLIHAKRRREGHIGRVAAPRHQDPPDARGIIAGI